MKNFVGKFVAYLFLSVTYGVPILDSVVKALTGEINLTFMVEFLLYFSGISYVDYRILTYVGMTEKDFVKLNEISLNFFKVLKTFFSSKDKGKSP